MRVNKSIINEEVTFDLRERKRQSPNGFISVGKVAQWTPGGHGFNPEIPQLDNQT